MIGPAVTAREDTTYCVFYICLNVFITIMNPDVLTLYLRLCLSPVLCVLLRCVWTSSCQPSLYLYSEMYYVGRDGEVIGR